MGTSSEAARSSVQHLQGLYTTVVGLGLALAMAEFVQPSRDDIVEWSAIPILLAYLVTLVPFYHGALRHLDDAYLTGDRSSRDRSDLLLGDFAVLFLESCALFALAAFIREPWAFGWTLVVLLCIDTAWGFLFRRLAIGGPAGAELDWAKINSVIVLLLVPVQLVVREVELGAVGIGLALLLVATVRSAADYKVSWGFYFPRAEADGITDERPASEP